MTKQEVIGLMKRIKANYSTFVNDEYKLDEWYEELKDYDNNDVQSKLEKHMRSEEYGMTEPKLYFLTKYLTKISEKNQSYKYLIGCPLCGEMVKEDDFDNHFNKCSSINYVERMNKKYFNKETDKAFLKELEDEKFWRSYKNFLGKIYDYLTKEEKDCVGRYLANE